MTKFILIDLVKGCKNYNDMGDYFWLIDRDLNFNLGLCNCETDIDILQLVKDALENEHEINVYFHHYADAFPKEVPKEVSNEKDEDEFVVVGEDGFGVKSNGVEMMVVVKREVMLLLVLKRGLMLVIVLVLMMIDGQTSYTCRKKLRQIMK